MRFKANKAIEHMVRDDSPSPQPQRAQSMAEINCEIRELINMSDTLKMVGPLRASHNGNQPTPSRMNSLPRIETLDGVLADTSVSAEFVTMNSARVGRHRQVKKVDRN